MFILPAFFNLFGVKTVTVPILKNKNDNHQDCDIYRPIAIATVVSKLFEQVILINIKIFLDTTDI